MFSKSISIENKRDPAFKVMRFFVPFTVTRYKLLGITVYKTSVQIRSYI